MSKENRKEELNATLTQAINNLNEIRGGVKAFMLLALTDEASEEEKDAVRGVNAIEGELGDLVILFNNIPNDIKHAAAMQGLAGILGKVLGGNEKSKSKKGEED